VDKGLSPDLEWLDRGDGERIAYARIQGAGDPGVLWLGGLHSDMTGTKATALAAWAERTGRACTRFDYFGHGASTGAFVDGTISRWRDDALAVLDQVTQGPQILVASSMGGWVATLVALARSDRVAGIVYIAPAPDFTELLMWNEFSDDIRTILKTKGVYRRPSDYDDDAYEISMRLIEDGRTNCVLGAPIGIRCPVRILHGTADADVPWRLSLTLIEQLQSDDVALTLVKDADHRISDPADIRRLLALVEDLVDLARIERTEMPVHGAIPRNHMS